MFNKFLNCWRYKMSIHELENRIKQLLENNNKLFIPYVMCGDGGFDKTLKLIRLLEVSGASIIEIGIPFSDPIADGPSIQAAGQRAINNGTTLTSIINFLQCNLPNNKVPRIIMTYLNPIIQYGLDRFFIEMETAQISGIIIPDLPFEEYDIITSYAMQHKIAIIPLIAPSTSMDRLQKISNKSNGFIYTVTINGTTGARTHFSEDILNRLKEIKLNTNMPVVAGFGVSTKEQIQVLSQHCDGVIVGSKIVDLAHANDYDTIKKLVTN